MKNGVHKISYEFEEESGNESGSHLNSKKDKN